MRLFAPLPLSAFCAHFHLYLLPSTQPSSLVFNFEHYQNGRLIGKSISAQILRCNSLGRKDIDANSCTFLSKRSWRTHFHLRQSDGTSSSCSRVLRCQWLHIVTHIWMFSLEGHCCAALNIVDSMTDVSFRTNFWYQKALVGPRKVAH